MARLLIIEDGVALASLLVSATSDRGHLASAYDDGRSGLQAASEERFDLAIVDLLLPDLRGAEVLERLRALGVPTIAMSGVFKGDRFARDAVERHGARAFFEKPFALDRLLDTVDAEVLRGKARDAEAASLPDAPPLAAAAQGPVVGGEVGEEEDDEAIELDFEVEIEMPTAEIHLDHPTTELELNPEALEAFQEALEHSADPSDGFHEPAPPAADTPLGTTDATSAPEGAASFPTSESESAPDAGTSPVEEDAETSFAGVLNDDPDDTPASAELPVHGAPEPTAPLPATVAARQTDQSAETTGAEPDFGRHEANAATDDEVTAPSPRIADDPADPAPDHPADDGQTSAAADGEEDGEAGASDAGDEGALTLLPSDVIQEDGDAGVGFALPEIPADVSEHVDHSLDETDAPGSDGAPDIPFSEHIDHALSEEEAASASGSSPHTPFSERAAVWEGEPVAPNVRARTLPPPEGSLGEHGLYGLLNACHQSRFTGTLHVEGEGQRVLTLVDGQLGDIRDPAHPGTLPSIAELSVQEGAFDEELLEEVRELAGHEGLSEDEALVLMGVLTPEQLSVRARARLRPLLAELLGWTDGQLRLTAGTSDAEVSRGARIPLAPIIFEAILARSEDALVARELSDDLCLALTEDPPYDLGEIPMSGAQAQLLAHSDGSKRIADLSLLSDLDARDVRLTLWALVRLGILAPMHPTRSSRRITFGL